MEETMKPGEGNPLATAPISRLLPQFAIPSVLSMLVDAFYNVVDQTFIGQGVATVVSVVGWLGCGRHFIRKPHGRLFNRADCGAAVVV